MQKHGGGKGRKKKRALFEKAERERDVLMEFVKITMRWVSLKPAFIGPLNVVVVVPPPQIK